MPPTPRLTAWLLVGLIALLAAWALVDLATLTRYPVAQCDEGYYGSVAATFAAEGRFGTPILGDLDGFRTNYMAIGRLHAGGLALLFRLLGVGLWPIRLFSYLGWLALVGMTYLCARRWYGPVPGVVAAALAGLSPSVMLRARIGRPEVWLGVLLLAQLFLYTELRARPRRPLSFGLGALISLSLATHFNAILFGFPLAVLVAHWLVIRRRDWPMLSLFVLGGLLGGIAVGAAQLLPDWRGALEQYRMYLDVFRIQPGSHSLSEALSTQAGWLYQNFIQLLPFLGVVETLTFIMGLIAALARRTEADVALVFAFLFALAAYTFQVAKAWYHVLPWLALGTLLFAGSISWWQERVEGWPIKWLSLLRVEWAAAPLALLYLVGSAWLVYSHRGYDYNAEAARIRDLADGNEGFFADPSWWPALYDTRFVGDWYLEWYDVLHLPGPLTPDEVGLALQRQGIHSVVLDGRLHCNSVREPRVEALEAYVTSACEYRGRVETPYNEPSRYSDVYVCPDVAE